MSYRLIKLLRPWTFIFTRNFQCTISYRLVVITCSFWRVTFFSDYPLSSPFACVGIAIRLMTTCWCSVCYSAWYSDLSFCSITELFKSLYIPQTWYYCILRTSVNQMQVSLKSDKITGYCTLRLINIFIVSLSFLFRNRNVSVKTRSENQNTYLVFNNCFAKIVPFMIQCGKIV